MFRRMDGFSKADVFNNSLGIAKVRFGINIETIRVFFVNESFCLFEGRTDMFFHFVQKSSQERLAKKVIVEMLNGTPKSIVREPTFGN